VIRHVVENYEGTPEEMEAIDEELRRRPCYVCFADTQTTAYPDRIHIKILHNSWCPADPSNPRNIARWAAQGR
jgi:hypothetical protein